MRKTKIFRLIILPILVVILLNGCDAGKAVIITVMAVAAVSGIQNSSDGSDEDGSKVDDNQTEDTQTDSSDTTTSIPTPEEPAFEIMINQYYDGGGDDLLTAGLRQHGLTGNVPLAANPVDPTAAEIRRATIVNQYQTLVDMRATSGYGSWYGPAVNSTNVDGKVAGKEFLTYADDGSGQKNVTMMVQVPDSFDRDNPCIVAAPSPGSLGVYGAIGVVGEWGLKNNCAVAYTDKGTGNGVHDLDTDRVNKIDGTREYVNNVVNQEANFIAQGDLSSYNSTHPHRIAQKHAHSLQNPEADWGKNVLEAIEFAFYVLNLKSEFGEISTLTSDNTLVIASGMSTGGAASLRAAEQDNEGLINGVVVAAPILNLRNFNTSEITIQQGNLGFAYHIYGKSLFDLVTYLNVYQPCASAGTLNLPARCTVLYNAGLLTEFGEGNQSIEAQLILNNYGTLPSTNVIAHKYAEDFVYASYANLYANAYGRFSVGDNLCGYSYAGVDDNEQVSAKSLADLADDFQEGSGIPPSSGTYLINDTGNNGEGIKFFDTIDNEGYREGYLEGARCLRRLATGTTGATVNTGNPLTGVEAEYYKRVQNGIEETVASGNLRSKPAIIVHGRDDALAHVNFTSRAYYILNKTSVRSSNLVYIEVKNANHFDTLEINNQVPLNYYLSQALDIMYARLQKKRNLPTSQVISTAPSASSQEARLPAIGSEEATCQIKFTNNQLIVPECE